MLVIKDQLLLNALLKALYAVKFETNPDEFPEIVASPYVAQVFDQTYDALIAESRMNKHEGTASELEKHRLASVRASELRTVKTHVRRSKSVWVKWSQEQKRDFVITLLSPYKADDTLLDQLIIEGDTDDAE